MDHDLRRELPNSADRVGRHEVKIDPLNRLTLSLAGLAIALLIVLTGLFLFTSLRNKAQVEDCILAGRINCDAVLAATR